MGVNGHWYVEIRKQAFWRGNPHTWVNRYVMSGAQPSAADAVTVISAIKGIEDNIYPHVAADAGVGFVDGKAYPSGKGTFFAYVPYNESQAAGSATGFTGSVYGGSPPVWANTLEVCFMMETPLNGLSSSGKPVYLRKFYRGMAGGDIESDVPGGIGSALITFFEQMVLPFQTGIGANNWVVIGNNGEQASGPPTLKPFMFNRQIPKGRKKKPTTSAGLLSQIAQDTLRLRGLAGLAGDVLEAAG
jgi:hypothetical protein